MRSIKLTLNDKLNYLMLRKKEQLFIVIFSDHQFLKYKLGDTMNVYFNKGCKVIDFKPCSFCLKAVESENFINYYHYGVTNYFLTKITFSGKSYKIKKKRSFLFEFNKSHIEAII